MGCEDIRREMLDRDWDRAALDRAAAILEHLQQCSGCRAVIDEYDDLRRLLAVNESDDAEGERAVAAAVREWTPLVAARRTRSSPAAAIAAIAASLLAAVLGAAICYQVAGPQRAAVPPQKEPPRPATVIVPPATPFCLTKADVDHGTQVFQTVSETFGGRASWVAIGDGAADLGLASAPPKGHKVLLLRMNVTRDHGPPLATDVVILPGQAAELDVPLESGQILHYSLATTAGPQWRLSIWAEVRTPGEGRQALAALATTLNAVPGRVLSAGRMMTARGGYNLEVCFAEHELAEANP